MSLFIDTTSGNDHFVFDDLLQIARCDTGLHWVRSLDGSLQVTFQPDKAGVASSDRLWTVVRGWRKVVIVGVADPNYVVPDARPPDERTTLSQNLGGATFAIDGSAPIMIYLDITNGGGQGYLAFDTSGLRILQPRQVILYHELSHAFHLLAGDERADREVQARTDENVFRQQVGLPLRDPNNKYGELGSPDRGPTKFPACNTYTGFNWDCIVVTAASGSRSSPQVAALERARGQYRNLSSWIALVAEPALDAYNRFSPGVVRAMHAEPRLRQAVLLYAVEPAVRLLQIAEAYLASDADTPALQAQVEWSFAEYVAQLAAAGGSADALAGASHAAAAAGRRVRTGEESVGLDDATELPGRLFTYLAAVISAQAAGQATYAWGFDGFALFLHHASTRFATGRTCAADVLSAVGEWLSRMPLPQHALSMDAAPEELRVLKERVFTRPYTRELFAQHLLGHWDDQSAPALRALLQRLGYGQGHST